MFNIDTVGSSTTQDGSQDPNEIRLFTEGVPSAATPVVISVLQSVGGEDDSASRELGRFAKSVGENGQTNIDNVWVIKRRDRYLQGSDQISFQQQGYPAARYTEPNENFDHEHQNVQIVNGVQFGDLVAFLDFPYLARAICSRQSRCNWADKRGAAVYGRGFAAARCRAMELITILNRCHHFRGFVYQHARSYAPAHLRRW